jgi:hypothetical protein
MVVWQSNEIKKYYLTGDVMASKGQTGVQKMSPSLSITHVIMGIVAGLGHGLSL